MARFENNSEGRAIWSSFARALDAELRTDSVIRGRSGLDHAVQAIAVDDRNRRVIIVAAEQNPRMAAMMQVDVQATMPNARVLVARPVLIDLPDLLRRVIQPLGLTEIDIEKARHWIHALKDGEGVTDKLVSELGVKDVVAGSVEKFEKAEMPIMPLILGLVNQAGELPWSDIMKIFGETAATGSLDLKALLATNSLAADLHVGVCPIPLYEMSEADVELFISGSDHDAVRERLRILGIHQYFFPSRDQLALGLIDQGLRISADVASVGDTAPTLGHPFGEAELIGKTDDFVATLAELKAAGFVAEGEFGIEITEPGKTIRGTIKVRPREGLLTKIMNRVNVSLSPFDLLK
jgi:hypothetical protein